MRTKLTNKDSIEKVISELTIDEKLNLVGEYTSSHSYAIPERDIPALFLVDGATGINGTQMILDHITTPGMETERLQQRFYMSPDFESLLTADLEEAGETYQNDADMLSLIQYMKNVRPNGKQYICFPSGINIGAGFSKENAKSSGEAAGWELRDSGVDLCMGPNVDIARDPLGGRNYEMYGEDPKLVADISAAYIEGMQQTGVGACAKHFIANNQETNRNISNAYVSERTLREIYARGFESSVKKGKVKSVMTAYSAVNDVFSSYNKHLLADLLKNEWGFQGIVVSDWGAVKEQKAESLEAGMDMILCGPNDMSDCKKAIEEGTFSEEVLNQRVYAILNLILELKETQKSNPLVYNQQTLLEAAYNTIVEGSTLLKNVGDVLPLEKNTKIAMYGRRSKELIECGTGSTNVTTKLHSNIWDECQKYSTSISFESLDEADTVIYTVGAPAGENMDRDVMDIEAEDRERLPKILKEAKDKGLKTVVILNISGPVDMRKWVDYADSILCIYIPGCMGGKATADLIFGKALPAGRLPVTFPLKYEDTPAFPNFPGEYVDCYYGEEIFVGYRSYDKKNIPVLFPFGYGLSYTQFEYESKQKQYVFDLEEQDKVQIKVTVKNIGTREGSEVIQVYGMEQNPRNRRPVKELFGFEKVKLQPGEKTEVIVTIDKESLRTFDAKMKRWVIPTGQYDLQVGISSRDIISTQLLQVKGKNPYPVNGDSTIGEIIQNPKAVETINQFAGGFFERISEENLKFMVQMKLSDVLSRGLISVIPDSAKVNQILSNLYEKLEALD